MITSILLLLCIYAIAASLILGSRAASKKFPRSAPVFSRIHAIGVMVAVLGGIFTIAIVVKAVKG